MKPNTKIIIAQLKTGNPIEVSIRDMLTIQQYAESVGLKVEIISRDKDKVKVKAV